MANRINDCGCLDGLARFAGVCARRRERAAPALPKEFPEQRTGANRHRFRRRCRYRSDFHGSRRANTGNTRAGSISMTAKNPNLAREEKIMPSSPLRLKYPVLIACWVKAGAPAPARSNRSPSGFCAKRFRNARSVGRAARGFTAICSLPLAPPWAWGCVRR